MNKVEAEAHLRRQFGYDSFRDRQWEVIQKLLNNKRILFIEKTGFGKSLCFQFPATVFPGLTLVFSPLIALMRNQVQALLDKGIEAACLQSNQSDRENEEWMRRAEEGQLKLLYIAPERLENREWMRRICSLPISMIVVDEAHCISTWGHDFRTSYQRIIAIIRQFPDIPIFATTATATSRFEKDILNQLKGQNETLRGDLFRSNIAASVITIENEVEKFHAIAESVKREEGTGIVYCGTQAQAMILSAYLQWVGISSAFYHAGLGASVRNKIEAALITNQYKCVVSTNALGMGIDKPDIRFVYHAHIPVSPIHYYQEIGRAGRDGNPSKAILFYAGKKDHYLPTLFARTAKPYASKYQSVYGNIPPNGIETEELRDRGKIDKNEFEIIHFDLVREGWCRELKNSSAYMLKKADPLKPFDSTFLEKAEKQRFADLFKMFDYLETTKCRMRFLCEFLGQHDQPKCGHCDNEINSIIHFPEQNKEDFSAFISYCFGRVKDLPDPQKKRVMDYLMSVRKELEVPRVVRKTYQRRRTY